MTCLQRPSTKCVQHLHFNGIYVKTTIITLEVSSNAILPVKARRAKTPGQHARAAEVEKNRISTPTQHGDDKKMCTAPKAGTPMLSF